MNSQSVFAALMEPLQRAVAEEGYTTTNAGGFSAWQRAGLPTRTAP